MLRVKAVIQCSCCHAETDAVMLFSGKDGPHLFIHEPEGLPDGWVCSDTRDSDDDLMVRCGQCAARKRAQ